MSVVNTELQADGKTKMVKGTAVFNGSKGKVRFNIFAKGDYRVVSTDYTSYSIVYSYTSIIGFLKLEALWILTRHQ